jgi:hypothetical protein
MHITATTTETAIDEAPDSDEAFDDPVPSDPFDVPVPLDPFVFPPFDMTPLATVFLTTSSSSQSSSLGFL